MRGTWRALLAFYLLRIRYCDRWSRKEWMTFFFRALGTGQDNIQLCLVPERWSRLLPCHFALKSKGDSTVTSPLLKNKTRWHPTTLKPESWLCALTTPSLHREVVGSRDTALMAYPAGGNAHWRTGKPSDHQGQYKVVNGVRQT